MSKLLFETSKYVLDILGTEDAAGTRSYKVNAGQVYRVISNDESLHLRKAHRIGKGQFADLIRI